MLPNNVVGVIFFIVIFIVGHALNLAINLLGAYVHTNRLQFVEFFESFTKAADARLRLLKKIQNMQMLRRKLYYEYCR